VIGRGALALGLVVAAACAARAAHSADAGPAGGPVSDAAVAPASLRAAVADSMRRVLDAALADSAFPGAFAVVGNRHGVIAEYAVGHLDWPGATPGAGTPPDERTLWDLASLTKVVATTSAIAQLVGEKRVALDAPVQRYLPNWTGPGKERVMVRHLLTHSGGLPAWRPLYKEAGTPAAALRLVYATELDTVPGARYLYSDLGAILLAQVVERVSGEPIDRYLERHLFAPLAMRDTRYRPAPADLARVAPTEYDPWRQRKLRGEVHDENAFALGRVAGHAGLFSTAHDLARFARMYLNGGTLDGARVLDAAVIRKFTARQDSALSHRALGWETPNGQNSAGRLMSATAFGHTGFTGTSLWVDPGRDLFVLLLTNRVNPTRQNTRIGAVRTTLADAVVAAARSSASPSSTSGR
jgi:CubicO group peptidase (beta-lactamase class C family)